MYTDPRISDLRAAVARSDRSEAERLFEQAQTEIETNPTDYADVLQYVSAAGDTRMSAQAKKILIEKIPLLQHPDYAPGVPLIASTNIKTVFNIYKTVQDLNAVLSKGSPTDSTEALERYNELRTMAPFKLTDDLARQTLDMCVAIADASGPAQLVETMPDLAGIFNWGMLHLHVSALPHGDYKHLAAAYEKCLTKPEDRAFVFRD